MKKHLNIKKKYEGQSHWIKKSCKFNNFSFIEKQYIVIYFSQFVENNQNLKKKKKHVLGTTNIVIPFYFM